jgi:hypothetical protein
MNAIFKPTRRKVIYASILTLLPYFLAFILVGLPNDSWDRGWFWLVAWAPLLFVGQLLPQYLSTDIWPTNNDLFLYQIYPLISFLVWYLVSCAIAFFIKDRTQYHTVNLVLIFLLCTLYLYLTSPRS